MSRFTFDEALLLPDFLSLLLKTKTFETIIQSHEKGLNQRNSRYNSLELLQIPLPPLAIQKQLSEVLNNNF